MKFNQHPEVEGRHAFLSPSKYHWLRYSDDKFDEVYSNALAAAKGTELHGIAQGLIRNRIKLPRSRKTLNSYVNDCIGHRMETEQILFYSMNAFGTADALSFKDMVLRIFDLKTGVNKASFNQLEVYAGLFCLEYNFKPAEIEIEMRIYQNDNVQVATADPDYVTHVMDRIVTFDRRITELQAEML